MALILRKLYHGYFYLSTDLRDVRTDGYLGMGSPLSLVSIITSYVFLVKYALPKYMEKRPPYDLKNIMTLYNIVQIIGNLYVAIKYTMIIKGFSLLCTPPLYTDTPAELDQIHVAGIYWYLKLFDCVDTIFFVLRKSFRQVSFLHVYHHSGMIFASWIGISYFPTGHTIWLPMINAWVHVIMFFYYLLTTLNGEWKKNIALKKLITQIQMVQFLALVIIYGAPSININCPYPKIAALLPIQGVFMFALFFDFYRQSYWKVKKSVKS